MRPSMPVALATELPSSTLLSALREQGCFADCYTTTLPRPVTQAQFVEAFYTTPLFKAERWVLRCLAGRRSSDAQARELARGRRDAFAVWKVAQRAPDQILLTDETGRTSSWLMVRPEAATSAGVSTRLFFGSAIRPRRVGATGQAQFGPGFHALLGLHGFYSRRLLQAAAARLLALGPAEAQ